VQGTLLLIFYFPRPMPDAMDVHVHCTINTRKRDSGGKPQIHKTHMHHSSSHDSLGAAANSIELHLIPCESFASEEEKERQHKLVDAQIQQTLEEMLNDGSGMKRSLSSMTLHLGSAGNLQLLQPSTVGLIAQAAPKKLHLSGLVIQSKSLAALIDKELESLSISDGLLPTQAEQEEFTSCLARMQSLKKLSLKPGGIATPTSCCNPASEDQVNWLCFMEGVLSAAGQLPHLQHLHITLPESYAECEQHPLSWSAAGAVAKLDHLQTLRLEARVPAHQRWAEVPTGALHCRPSVLRAENEMVASLQSTKLTVLELQGTVLQDPRAWDALARCPHLAVLTLGAVGASAGCCDDSEGTLPAPESLPGLRKLRLGSAVSPRTLCAMLRAAPGLEELTVEGGDCMVDFSISSAATATAKGAPTAAVPAGVICVRVDGIQGIPGSSASLDHIARELREAAQLLQPIMAQRSASQRTLALMLGRPTPYTAVPCCSSLLSNGGHAPGGAVQNGSAAAGNGKVPNGVGAKGHDVRAGSSSSGGSSGGGHSRKASEEEIMDGTGPSAAEVGVLISALQPLKGCLHELQLQRTTLGPKSLQTLCTSVARTLGQQLETLVLGFVVLESPSLPALLPASVLALRLESCAGVGASAGVLAPWVLHCSYTRRQLQLSVIHHSNVAQPNSPDQRFAAEAEMTAFTLAQVLPVFKPPGLLIPRLRGPLRGVALRCHMDSR